MVIADEHIQPDTEQQLEQEEWSASGPLGLLAVALGMMGLMGLLWLGGISPSPLTWYLARASGFTLYLLFWLATLSGLLMSTKVLGFSSSRPVVWQIHRTATSLGYAFLGLHILSLAFDPTVPLGFRGVLVPFTSDVRQPWTDLGILTAYGMVIVTASFSLRGAIGTRLWRLLHYGTFPLWITALLHGIGAGSDSTSLWAVAIYLPTTGLIAFLTLYRLMGAVNRRLEPSAASSAPPQG